MEQSKNCVECGAKIDKLIKRLPHNEYELSLCKECGLIADPYIEYDLNLKVLHMLLCRSQVYRHFLYNHVYSSEYVSLSLDLQGVFACLFLACNFLLLIYLFTMSFPFFHRCLCLCLYLDSRPRTAATKPRTSQARPRRSSTWHCM